jgi:hypothetical protein
LKRLWQPGNPLVNVLQPMRINVKGRADNEEETI